MADGSSEASGERVDGVESAAGTRSLAKAEGQRPGGHDWTGKKRNEEGVRVMLSAGWREQKTLEKQEVVDSSGSLLSN